MLGYQSQHQGSTAGLHYYGGQCYSYAIPLSRTPKSRDSEVRQYERTLLKPIDSTLTLIASQHTPTNGSLTFDIQSKPSMPFSTYNAQPKDLPRLVDIEFAAFREEKVNHHLSYRDASDRTHLERAIRTYKKMMSKPRLVATTAGTINIRRRSDSKLVVRQLVATSPTSSLGYRFRKVSDEVTGEIIAFAKSEMTTLTPEDMRSPLDAGHEGEPQMNRDWFALNEKLHREYNGLKKHCYFGMLATHPNHQHRGAASLLMDELVAEADALGVEIYCEATRTGRPLYEKYGFVTVKDIIFDPAGYHEGAGLGIERQTVMVRGAMGADGVRREVRMFEVAAAEAEAEMQAASS